MVDKGMWHSVEGYVIIQIKGTGVERLLNEMRAAGIPVRDLVRVGRTEYRCRLRAADFRRLHALRRHCRIHILRRGGPSVWLARLFRRRALWIGLLLAAVLIGFLSTRICIIRVVGCERVAERTVLRSLASLGVTVGRSRSGLSLPVLGEKLMASDDRIGWAGLSLDGVVLTVEIVEMIHAEEPVDPEKPCDVVAVKDGVIVSAEAVSGNPLVRAGDMVQAGDVLIAGDLTREDSQTPLRVHAFGEVRANVYYFAEAAVTEESETLQPSGRTAAYRAVYIAGHKLFESEIPFEEYELSNVRTALLPGAVLPLEVVDAVCGELTMQPYRIDAAERRERAAFEAEQGAFLRVPSDAQIVEKTIAYAEHEGCTVAVICVMTEETIGMERELPDDGNE